MLLMYRLSFTEGSVSCTQERVTKVRTIGYSLHAVVLQYIIVLTDE
jgi:hypothetical protein